jgi:hypothetical protein
MGTVNMECPLRSSAVVFWGVDQGDDPAPVLWVTTHKEGLPVIPSTWRSPIARCQGATTLTNRTLPRKRPLDTVR